MREQVTRTGRWPGHRVQVMCWSPTKTVALEEKVLQWMRGNDTGGRVVGRNLRRRLPSEHGNRGFKVG